MNFMTHYARSLGKLPDRYWYQLNGKSAQENYSQQRGSIYEIFADQEDGETVFLLSSEAKIK